MCLAGTKKVHRVEVGRVWQTVQRPSHGREEGLGRRKEQKQNQPLMPEMSEDYPKRVVGAFKMGRLAE